MRPRATPAPGTPDPGTLLTQMPTHMNMHDRSTRVSRILTRSLAAAAVVLLPGLVHAQKWVGTIGNMTTIGGAADITVEPRGDKESRVKISLRNTKKELRLGWDVVEGLCRQEGRAIAPQAKFQVLQVNMDGSSTGTANVPKLESGKNYYVRVFEAGTMATDADAYGCAAISEKAS